MPSKNTDQQSKKALQKKKDKLLDDKTFGLKNKNKSAKVQQYVQSTTKAIMNSGSDAQARAKEHKMKEEKLARKTLKKAMEAEQAALFGEALLAVNRKGGGQKFGKNEGKVEAKGRDHDDGNGEKKGGTSHAMKLMYQMDAQEMEDKLKEDPNYVPTLEDTVEAQRQQKLRELRASGLKGTPVTPATFREWQERKRKRKEAEMKKLVEAEMKKKKGGKGLSVLSGRELYNYKRELFKDQEGDADLVMDVANKGSGEDEEKSSKDVGIDGAAMAGVDAVVERVEKDLFLNGDDVDLDDLEDD